MERYHQGNCQYITVQNVAAEVKLTFHSHYSLEKVASLSIVEEKGFKSVKNAFISSQMQSFHHNHFLLFNSNNCFTKVATFGSFIEKMVLKVWTRH